MPFELVTILGPTAVGKTRIAVNLASKINGEIISADSRQVYTGMDIGTGKDLIEFKKNNIKYHLIDIVDPTEEYNIFRFAQDFKLSLESIKNAGRFPLMVGGSGLYLSVVLQSYQLPSVTDFETDDLGKKSMSELQEMLLQLKPKLHNITDFNSQKRLIKAILIEQARKQSDNKVININSLNVGIKLNREEIKNRITERLKSRLANGMIDEVKGLIQKGVSHEKLQNFGLEYKFISLHLIGKLNYNDMFQKLNSSIHTFAKKQMTWFRKMEKEGVEINWFRPEQYDEIENFVLSKLNNE
ncbi:MAG: tRNA (adenosine(37)-N6)-dimethylallyltransferase MiaA [bacterium]|nr:tRNA (adenosine(37)-N6)-dimethylallyltransferase MiaA [bacterium]